MDLPTHDTGHGLIRILVLRNPFGGESVNTEPRVWAAVDKGVHYAINAIRADRALICLNEAMIYSSSDSVVRLRQPRHPTCWDFLSRGLLRQ